VTCISSVTASDVILGNSQKQPQILHCVQDDSAFGVLKQESRADYQLLGNNERVTDVFAVTRLQ
jgi:hypothetical protein